MHSSAQLITIHLFASQNALCKRLFVQIFAMYECQNTDCKNLFKQVEVCRMFYSLFESYKSLRY